VDVPKKRLVLITDGFPYGKGEKPFILPELPYLREEFDVTILAQTDISEASATADMSPLDDDVRLLTYIRPRVTELLLYAFAMPFQKVGRRELRSICGGVTGLYGIAHSIKAYATAEALRRFMRCHGLFNSTESTVFYSFWFSAGCLAVALEKQESCKRGPRERSYPCIRLVSRIHGYDLYEERAPGGHQPLQRFKADMCDTILFISRQGKEYFSERFGPEPRPGEYVLNYLGIDFPDEANPSASAGTKLRIVSCSNIIPVKRVGLLAEAIGLLGDLDIEWVHFGDGPGMEEVRNIVKRYSIAARLMGNVPNDEVLKYYACHHIDVFVNVSSSEGLPVSLIEAASYGIPLIVTDVGGSKETIDGNGVVLNANPSPLEVASAIRGILSQDMTDVDLMRRRSRALIEERFERQRCKRALLDVLGNATRQCVNTSSSAAATD
jgi:glycosyltransferase involved in cell wall biosynthesis